MPYRPGAYGQPDFRQRLMGIMATLALHLAVLALTLWGGWRLAAPPASAARDTVVTTVAIAQAAPQPHPEQVPPGPRRHQSEAQRAAAQSAVPHDVPPVRLVIPAAPSMPTTPRAQPNAVPAANSSSASVAVERTTAPPVMTAPRAQTSAARENVAAEAKAAQADWQARVLGHLRQYRRYPRAAESGGQQGVVLLAITLDRQGRVLSLALRRGSGYPLLDAEALATVRRATPLPPPDAAVPGDPVQVDVPVSFSLRERGLS